MSAHGWTIGNISIDVHQHNVSLGATRHHDGKHAALNMTFPLNVTGNEPIKDAERHAKDEAKRVLHALIEAL